MAPFRIKSALIMAGIALGVPASTSVPALAAPPADQSPDAEAKSRQRAMIEAHKLVEQFRKQKRGVSIGMKADEILHSTWGKPRSINITINASGRHEQWVYPGFQYLYVDNGVLTSIQTNQKSP